MQIGFYVDQNRCNGCFTCIVGCKDWHDVPAGPASWMRVKTIEKGNFPDLFVAFLPMTCFHCEKPACVDACPTNAITKQPEDGVVVVNQEDCIGAGCSVCRDVCPYDAPQFRSDDARMEKCNLCPDRWAEGKKPICVDACPVRALDAGPIDELRQKYGILQDAEGFTYSPETSPSVIFKPRKDTKGRPLKGERLAPITAR